MIHNFQFHSNKHLTFQINRIPTESTLNPRTLLSDALFQALSPHSHNDDNLQQTLCQIYI